MHPLDGPRAKVKRANSQLVTLQKVTQRFFEINRYTVVLAEFDRKTGGQNVRISNCPTLPDEWGVIIGEIAHDLRSALDLLAWQLRCKYVGDSDTTIQFPIYERGRTKLSQVSSFWIKTKKGWDVNRHTANIDRKFWKRLESFQPYKRRNKGRHSPFFLLQKLNNTDKHHLITVLTPALGSFTFHGLIGGGSKFNKRMSLHPNAKVGYVMPLQKGDIYTLSLIDGQPKMVMKEEVDVNFDITPGIRFGDGCDAVKRLPVVRTLRHIADEVSRIVESFSGEF